jgi:hypothetical protein
VVAYATIAKRKPESIRKPSVMNTVHISGYFKPLIKGDLAVSGKYDFLTAIKQNAFLDALVLIGFSE